MIHKHEKSLNDFIGYIKFCEKQETWLNTPEYAWIYNYPANLIIIN